MEHYSGEILSHYEKMGQEPLFPFSYGLSYTTFELDNMVAQMSFEGVSVQVTVINTGDRSGATVVQLYVGAPDASVERSIRELKTFAKVRLDPGASRDISFDLSPRDFAFFDVQNRAWRVEAGNFEISIEFSVVDLRTTTSLEMPETEIGP